MCGITGYFSKNKQINCEKFYKAHKLIAHRGPDDEGFILKSDNELVLAKGDDTVKFFDNLLHINNFENSSIILGHRRLSIIDLSSAGHQPFIYEHLSMVYNGEIYNYLELKEELKKFGYEFKTKTDTEVVLKAFHKWGIECFNRFNGMWALAIYDKKENKLILSRDRFGIKPLFYYKNKDEFYFASEIKFLLEFIDKREANQEMVIDYLKNNYLLHTEETMFKNIYQVEPGFYISIDTSINIIKNKYWNLKIKNNKSSKKEVENLLTDSIKIRLRADVKIGALLSGGIDSSVLVGIMDKKLNIKNLETFSAIFEGYEEYSEQYLIEKNIKTLSIKNHFINPSYSDIKKNLDNLFYIQELPIRSLAIYSQFALYEYIHSNTNIKVVLNGQGSDEIFSGYSDHIYYYIISLFEKLQFKQVINEIKLYSKLSEKNVLMLIKQLFKIWVKERFLKYNPKKYSLKKTKKRYKKYFNDIFLDKLYHDLTFSALKEYLHYDDRNSMQFSIESRLPYLDYRLVELVYSLEIYKKCNNSTTKYILREIGKNYVHDKIIKNKIKMGFISPQEYWQKNELQDMFDRVFKDIRENGLFDFLNHKKFCEYYELYKIGKFSDWTFIWRLFSLYKWKQVWSVNK